MSVDDAKIRILNAVNLRDLIGETVPLTEKSGRPSGCCPFHAEKSPSFYIYDNRYHCFGCKAGGDAIEFVKHTQSLSFIESLKYLARKYGIEAPELERSSHDLQAQKKTASQYTMMVEAHQFYVDELKSARGEETKNYLRERGFSDENIKEFGFGLTPAENFGLVHYLRKQGHREDDMIECGLATKSNRDGKTFDFFRGRLMIPIKEQMGRVIAFGGRTIDGHKAKYINSRDSKMYDKGRTLFGFDRARTRIRNKTRAIVVEGYMDTLQLWQQGFDETTACLGTALTETHLKLLSNATSSVYLLFDGDSAGHRATLSAVNVALAVPKVEVKAIVLPSGEDPDDYVRKHGAEALEKLITNAADLLDFAIMEKLKVTHRLGVPDLINKEFIPWLAKITDGVQKSFLVNRISQLSGVPVAQIESSLRPAGMGGRPYDNGGHQNHHTAMDPRFEDIPHPYEVANNRNQNDNVNRYDSDPHTDAAPRKITPLTSSQLELFGHIFYSNPGELNLQQAQDHAHNDLEIDDIWLNFFDEMLNALRSDKAPHSVEKQVWTASLSEPVAVLIERLLRAKSAFEVKDRPGLIVQLISADSAKKATVSLKHLKTELSRISGMPGTEDEVGRILRQILEITQEIGKPQQN